MKKRRPRKTCQSVTGRNSDILNFSKWCRFRPPGDEISAIMNDDQMASLTSIFHEKKKKKKKTFVKI